MPERIRVLVDMDGVLSDLERRLHEILQQQHPHIRRIPGSKHIYSARNYPEKYWDIVVKIPDKPGFIESLPLVPGALEGWQRLVDTGYDVRVCSTPFQTSFCEAEKRRWLKKYFGPRVAQEAIITKEKHLVDGEVLIDDKLPSMMREADASWTQAVFDRPCNRRSGRFRIRGWNDPDLLRIVRAAHMWSLRTA